MKRLSILHQIPVSMSAALRTVRVASTTLNAAHRPFLRNSCRCIVISSNLASSDRAAAHRRSYQHAQIRGMMSKGFQRLLKVAGVNAETSYESDEPLMNRYAWQFEILHSLNQRMLWKSQPYSLALLICTPA
jgi:hypothetical protein